MSDFDALRKDYELAKAEAPISSWFLDAEEAYSRALITAVVTGALVPRVEAHGEVASRCPACGEEMYPLTIAEMEQEHMRNIATLTAERAERDAAFVALWKAADDFRQRWMLDHEDSGEGQYVAAIEAARPFIEEALS